MAGSDFMSEGRSECLDTNPQIKSKGNNGLMEGSQRKFRMFLCH